ncbi:acetyl-CoA C-acetyltransferase [Corynebacterium efficiens YS-314]|uniref:Probable acetyl-CoA acetyltransferase n=1 Tax=Corynebacterium efficiens (strain DSM 44549 / YS-314 / AJ 12310 / JCM 11189 / NBRC 100395) TaxID=196164 RepID=Q8FRM9_COREF|nr:acetyl-CoA C-acetyltransferase [Corynebacterium efficiens]EEW50327.1 acetyl-CoA C-acetyltransferase [Corynebacterium efficiens YS-314]BAC17541.1 putative acetyl-CoA acetyltransferase [Corynebacterium efficiens YS-314]
MTTSSKTPNDPSDIVILGARRTPQGKLLGQLSTLTATQLGGRAIAAALESAGVRPDQVDQVIMGQVVQSDAGQNPARQAAVEAGIGLDVPAVTVNSVCLSGLRAITDAARLLRLGEAEVVVAGGQESMSGAPHLLPGARRGVAYGSVTAVDSLERDALTDAFDQRSMGVNTDEGNGQFTISREQQDEVAALSHQRAAAAWEEGAFDAEITPVEVTVRKKGTITIDRDEGIRPETTVDSLAGLRPAFTPDGSITAGNSSPISDGAAATVLSTRAFAEAHGLEPLATIVGWANTAGPDTLLHAQPARATRAVLERAGWSTGDLDFLEINEAFGAVAVESLRELDYPLERTNIHGGAIALGHPVGTSGARIVVHAAHELARRGGGRAAVSICGGGGQGDALLLAR